VHFADVEEGLARVCREFGLDVAIDLTRKNCGAGRDRPLTASAGSLAEQVDRAFAWYQPTFGHADHPAARRQPPARLAA